MTLLYLYYTTIFRENADVKLSNYTNLGLLNITNSRIHSEALRKLLFSSTKISVLLMRNSSITDLNQHFFVQLRNLKILDLQENFIPILTSGCFKGLTSITLLDLHSLSIYKIQSKCFESMESLVFLNLSSNYLEFIPNDIFHSLYRLRGLDLRGNIFKSIDTDVFRQLISVIFASTNQLCCYIEEPSICETTNTRYTHI